MGYYLSAEQLKQLRTYKYSGLDKSLISRYVLNPFWTWFVTLWPASVAPNTITFLGLCIVFLNFAILLWYDPLYRSEAGGASGPPNWVYFTWAAGLFWYQAFDAIDGKQARRTGMAGPLGEMFDHGCDAINTTLEVLLCAQALNLGRNWWTVASELATLANFYLTTWEEFHTGTLFLGYFSGPVEGILMIVGIYIITGLYGPSFWDTPLLTFLSLDKHPLATLLIPNKPLNESFMIFGALALLYNIVGAYWDVLLARRSRSQPILPPLLGLIPFLVTCALQLAWLWADEALLLQSGRFLPFVCAWGLQFAHQVGRMILAHVTKNAFPFWDWMWPWTLAMAVDANAPFLFGRSPLIQSTPLRADLIVLLTLLVSLIYYVRFCTLVIWDITDYLGIACFSVQKKDSEGTWVRAQMANGKKE
ncbi:Choline/ethanolaminephosphotransferase [Calocera viscosa TUFC12733]|uniref:diacylglycerol cholinephosphotransferase n=1 Tax=Calocera viscosa (strain TUFC12733) TaxID=1330018 RepID=A0A167M777_CALVF|nr:Choline/ethanolaminephosphotransferase [Calocera viscosa TUFC12733]